MIISLIVSFVLLVLPFIFPKTLSDLIGKADISQRELARRCGVTAPTIAELLKGQRCSEGMLMALASEAFKGTGLADYEGEMYTLLIAHLHDEALRSGIGCSGLLIRRKDELSLGDISLPPLLDTQIALIAREAIHDEDLRGMLAHLADHIAKFLALKADHVEAYGPDDANHASVSLSAEQRKQVRAADEITDQLLSEARARKDSSSSSKAAS